MRPLISRRNFVGATLTVPALGATGLAHAQQAWPNKPVRIVVPIAPGGTTDLLPRVIGQPLLDLTGQSFVVDSKPGASGQIGAAEVARNPPDGYTLLVATTSFSVANAVSSSMRFNVVEDFTPIALLADANNLLLVSPTLKVKTFRELIELARQRPGFLNYTSSGIGTFAHLIFEMLRAQAGINITHVPYKGSGQTIPDLISGAVHMSIDAVPSGMPHVKDGRVLGLAVTGSQRTALAPEIPTIAESGLPDFSVLSWFGLYGPPKMPADLTRRINEVVNKVLHTPEMVARFATLGIEPGKGTATEFAAMVAADTARWKRIARAGNIKVD